MKEKALRGTQIRSIHEMGESKRGQEFRVDEFSAQKIERKLWHDTERDLQERVNCMKCSREFQDVESNYSGKISHVPSQEAAIPSLRSMPSRDSRLPLDTWICRNHRETFWAIHALCSIHHRHLIKEFFTLRFHVLQVRFQWDTCREW